MLISKKRAGLIMVGHLLVLFVLRTGEFERTVSICFGYMYAVHELRLYMRVRTARNKGARELQSKFKG